MALEGCSTAAAIRRHTAAPLSSLPAARLVSACGAFLKDLSPPALEHGLRRSSNVDPAYHAAKAALRRSTQLTRRRLEVRYRQQRREAQQSYREPKDPFG